MLLSSGRSQSQSTWQGLGGHQHECSNQHARNALFRGHTHQAAGAVWWLYNCTMHRQQCMLALGAVAFYTEILSGHNVLCSCFAPRVIRKSTAGTLVLKS